VDLHGALSVVACAGHLAFAIVVWLRRGKSTIAPLLSLLFLDAFVWNFAALASALTDASEWSRVDRFFSSFMAVLALHAVAVFVGRGRTLGTLVRGAYALSLALALVGAFDTQSRLWWIALLVCGNAAVVFAVGLLAVHRGRSEERAERARTDLILAGLVVAALLGSTDLWADEVGAPIPPLGNVGTLVAMLLFAVATLRLRLIDTAVPAVLFVYALAFAVLGVTAYLLAVHWLERHTALGVLAALTLGVLGLAIARELRGSAAVARERVHRLATLGRFSEQLAHDLRNPLAALKGAVQFLKTERAQGRPLEPHGEFLDLMSEQVERMQRVVGDYQRMAKVEAVLAPGSLNDVVSEVLGMQRFAVVSGVALNAEFAEDLPPAKLDKDLVATTLENVLRNAYEAMPNGGTVTVRTERMAGAGGVAVSVEDEGHGMDARVLDRASDEFFTTKAAGTGLGLSFAERVAHAHGGTLSLTSRAGKGTVVRLCLPALTQPEPP
jgi:two-component system, NtrC family, sensor histidine kinase HydH